MTSQISKQEFRQRIILAELARRPLNRNDLTVRALAKGLSPGIFQVTFRYLKETGRVQKESSEKRATWLITAKGRKLLEALS